MHNEWVTIIKAALQKQNEQIKKQIQYLIHSIATYTISYQDKMCKKLRKNNIKSKIIVG